MQLLPHGFPVLQCLQQAVAPVVKALVALFVLTKVLLVVFAFESALQAHPEDFEHVFPLTMQLSPQAREFSQHAL